MTEYNENEAIQRMMWALDHNYTLKIQQHNTDPKYTTITVEKNQKFIKMVTGESLTLAVQNMGRELVRIRSGS